MSDQPAGKRLEVSVRFSGAPRESDILRPADYADLFRVVLGADTVTMYFFQSPDDPGELPFVRQKLEEIAASGEAKGNVTVDMPIPMEPTAKIIVTRASAEAFLKLLKSQLEKAVEPRQVEITNFPTAKFET